MAEAHGRRTLLRFRDVVIDVAHNRVDIGDASHQIEPKPMEVLFALALRNGQVVSRQDVIDEVWGVAYGGDESLTRAISLLRKVLPDHIRTIPKRGYVFTAEPEALEAQPSRSAWRRRRLWIAGAGLAVLAATGISVLVVLIPKPVPPPVSQIEGIVVEVKPFIAAGEGHEAAVATARLTSALSHFDQIKVRAFGAGAPADPRQDYIYTVTGAIAGIGARAHLDVQLLDPASGDTLWSGSAPYDDRAASALAAELEPAAVIVTKRRVQSRPAEQLSPWELILLGTWVPGADQEWQGPPGTQPYWVWERAIAQAPDFALAHASLAQVMANFALFDPPSDTPQAAARAARAADRALQLAPYDAGVLYQIALYDRYAGRREAAIATFDQVLAREPDNVAARIERIFAQGQCTSDSAAATAQLQALDAGLPPADPRHWVILSRLADLALGHGDYAAARDYAVRSRLMVRQVWSSVTLAAADAELGGTGEARLVGMEHHGQWPGLDYGRFAGGPLSRWCYGGDTSRAADAFRKLDKAIKNSG